HPSTLLPYTTLFRSYLPAPGGSARLAAAARSAPPAAAGDRPHGEGTGCCPLRTGRASHSRGGTGTPRRRGWPIGGGTRDPSRRGDRKSTRLNSSHEW